MLRYMLDTNICIYVIKNRPEALRDRFNEVADFLCMSSIVQAELLYGAEKSDRVEANLKRVESFCARLTILPFDEAAAWHFGNIRATLERQGATIGPYDLMIAGHTRSVGLTLITNNEREFRRVDGLRVENWVTPG
jgi:tRNA(fMet)-specific endonuclease VapC